MSQAPDRGSLRERKKQATRQSLHAAALRLMSERGPDGFTVEELCAEVNVSSRTFFNYYPSKVAAVLDLPELDLGEPERQAFLTAKGPLLDDLCRLVAEGLQLPGDYPQVKALMHEYPDVSLQYWQQMRTRWRPVFALIVERTGDKHLAAQAIGLLVVALSAAMQRPGDGDATETLQRIRAEITSLGELIASER